MNKLASHYFADFASCKKLAKISNSDFSNSQAINYLGDIDQIQKVDENADKKVYENAGELELILKLWDTFTAVSDELLDR